MSAGLSVAEAARECGISTTLAYRLIERGDMPAVRLGDRRLVVPRRELEEWLGDRARADQEQRRAAAPAGQGA